ncbi:MULTISPECIES: hypothetical protein [Sphingobacterium]|uniref:hypothetical protein n=1 Tax=Sphingobacterium TaxID=28453 RepID=UPI0024A761E8|nr:hypothetical protein [Sphingobacterium thalpophilum]
MPHGFVVKEVPMYYNDSLKLLVHTFGDYVPYNNKYNHGFKVDGLYKTDKEIVKRLHLDRSKMKILFSGIPDGEPFYHLICFYSTDVNLIENNRGAIPKMENDTLRYYYKMLNHKEWRVYQTIIPFRDGSFNFVYYQKQIDSCVYCDIETLSMRASKSLNSGDKIMYFNPDHENNTDVRIEVPKDKILNKPSLLKLYDIEGKKLIDLKFLRNGIGRAVLKASKGNFIVTYSDLNNNIKWQKNINVD